MSWIRGSSSGHIALSNDVVAAVTATSADSVDSVAAGGTGYVVGDLITLTGGTFSTATVLEVVTLSGSAVATARIYNAGVYSAAPGDPVSQGSTDGSGTGATFNMTYSSNGWTADRDTTWTGSERDVILHGSGGGSDTIYVGWRTFNDSGAGQYNWELHGFTGFNSGLDHLDQAGVSPGDHTSGTTALQWGAYLPLSAGTLEWFLSVTPFRILLEVKVSSNYYGCYLGFLNRYATTTEYPYPLCIAGSTNWLDAVHSQSEKMSGLTDPWQHGAAAGGIGTTFVLDSAGSWRSFANSGINGGTRNSASALGGTLPCGAIALTTSATNPAADDFMDLSSAATNFSYIVEQADLNAPDANLEPTPGSVDEYVLFPTMLFYGNADGSNTFVPGEMDGLFYFVAFGGVVSEDRIIKSGVVYRVFQNCNRTGAWEHLAVEEA